MHYSQEQYECHACDHIARAVKSNEDGTPAEGVDYHHLTCANCGETIIFLSHDVDDDFGFDDDAGEED